LSYRGTTVKRGALSNRVVPVCQQKRCDLKRCTPLIRRFSFVSRQHGLGAWKGTTPPLSFRGALVSVIPRSRQATRNHGSRSLASLGMTRGVNHSNSSAIPCDRRASAGHRIRCRRAPGSSRFRLRSDGGSAAGS